MDILLFDIIFLGILLMASYCFCVISDDFFCLIFFNVVILNIDSDGDGIDDVFEDEG